MEFKNNILNEEDTCIICETKEQAKAVTDWAERNKRPFSDRTLKYLDDKHWAPTGEFDRFSCDSLLYFPYNGGFNQYEPHREYSKHWTVLTFDEAKKNQLKQIIKKVKETRRSKNA